MKRILKQHRRTAGWYQQRSIENALSYQAKEQAFYSKHVSASQKVFFLQRKFPENTFFQSLYSLIGKASYSARQLDCIDGSYVKLFSEEERNKHLSIHYRNRGQSSLSK